MVRLDRELLQAIEEWRRRQPDTPSRSEAMRRVLRLGLKATRLTRLDRVPIDLEGEDH